MPQFQPIDLAFPLGGIDVSRAVNEQRASVAPLGASYDPSFQQQKFETTRSGINCRGFDALAQRFRGGSRPALTKYVAGITSANPAQHLTSLVSLGITAPGGSQPANQSGRVVTLVAFVNGVVYVASPGSTAWTAVTVGSGSINTTGLVQSAPNVYPGSNNPYLLFVDGTNYGFYNPVNNTRAAWTASAGALPASGSNKARLVALWNGRTVLSGLKGDPLNWFMSKQGDPTDWNYAPASPSAVQAVAGNNTSLGKLGDNVSALCPINDQNLVMLGDHSVYMMRGDPMQGGTLTCIEEGIGGAFATGWCVDTEGTLYFVSNRLGVYQFSQFDYPRRISQRIDPLLSKIDSGANRFSMVWDDLWQGFHLFVTPTAAAGASTHYFWERRTGAWWQDTFANNSFNPLACCTFDGNSPTDRRALVMGSDGYVRYFNAAGTTDDGQAVPSSVVMGPLVSGFEQLMLRELRGLLGTGSGAVTWQLYAGPSAEDALNGNPVASGTWNAGLNGVQYVRRTGKAMYLKLSSSSPWALEKVKANVAALGAVRERGSR